MRLASMRYKDYVWPHNPRVYTIEYKRTMGARKVPFGRYHLQDLGPAQRVMPVSYTHLTLPTKLEV